MEILDHDLKGLPLFEVADHIEVRVVAGEDIKIANPMAVGRLECQHGIGLDPEASTYETGPLNRVEPQADRAGRNKEIK